MPAIRRATPAQTLYPKTSAFSIERWSRSAIVSSAICSILSRPSAASFVPLGRPVVVSDMMLLLPHEPLGRDVSARKELH
jgi:hypothetical protein